MSGLRDLLYRIWGSWVHVGTAVYISPRVLVTFIFIAELMVIDNKYFISSGGTRPVGGRFRAYFRVHVLVYSKYTL